MKREGELVVESKSHLLLIVAQTIEILTEEEAKHDWMGDCYMLPLGFKPSLRLRQNQNYVQALQKSLKDKSKVRGDFWHDFH